MTNNCGNIENFISKTIGSSSFKYSYNFNSRKENKNLHRLINYEIKYNRKLFLYI
jgi:hypothetical protein